MTTFLRAAWGAQPAKSVTRFTPQSVAWHWTAVDEPDKADWPAVVRGIQQYHLNLPKENYSDIAYNWLFAPNGDIFEGRGWTAQSGANGTAIANKTFLAFCYLDKQLTDAAKHSMRQMFDRAEQMGYVHRPDLPHSAIVPTACPGDQIREWLAAGKPTSPQIFPPAPPIEFPVKEEDMKSALVSVGPLDKNGNGYADWNPQFRRNPVIVAASLQGPNPPKDGYWYEGYKPIVAAQPFDMVARVSVIGGRPKSTVGVNVSVV